MIPFEDILEAQIALGSFGGILDIKAPLPNDPPQFEAVIDGRVPPFNPMDRLAWEPSRHVPLLIGYCLHDGGWPYMNFDLNDAGLQRVVEGWTYARRAAAAVRLYRSAYPKASAYLLQAAMITDRNLLERVTTFAENKGRLEGAPAWVYRVDWPSPAVGGRHGATHGMDMSLVFHNTHQPTLDGDRPEARALADIMASAWAAFARTGTPATERLPSWPAYGLARRETLLIDYPEQRVAGDPNGQFRTF